MPKKYGQLTIYDPHRSSHLGEVLVQEAESDQRPDLIVLLEIDENNDKNYQFLQNFLKIVYEAYENAGLLTAEKSLGKIMQTLNEQLALVMPKTFDWLRKFHCFIGLLEEQNLYFTYYGKIKTYLIRGGTIKQVNEVIEIKTRPPYFEDVFIGQIKDNDRLLATTLSLIDYVSLEKIKKIVGTLPPQSSVAHLTNILEAVPPTVAFFSVIFEPARLAQDYTVSTTVEPAKAKIYTKGGSKNSLDQLLQSQAETEKILTPPSLWEAAMERAQKLLYKKDKAVAEQKPTTPKIVKVAVKPTKRPSSFWPKLLLLIRLIGVWIIKILIALFNLLKQLFFLITKPNYRQNAAALTSQTIAGLISRYNGLPKKKKIILVSLLTVFFLLSQGLIWQGRRVADQQQQTTYQNLISQINNDLTSIDTALIYDDQARPPLLLAEIDNLLKQLPTKTSTQKSKYNELQTLYLKEFNSFYKISQIDNPNLMIDLATKGIKADLKSMALSGTQIYLFLSDNRIFRYNLADGGLTIVPNANLNVTYGKYLPKSQTIVAVTVDKKFYSITNDTAVELAASLPPQEKNIDGLAFYADKMFLIDHGTSQLYRLTYTAKGFTAPRYWLKDTAGAADINDIAVDGFVYAIKTDGSLIKYGAGRNQNWPPLNLNPNIGSNSKIYTEDGFNNVYVLDSQNNRIVVVNKNGALQKVIMSSKFTQLKDLIIKEKEKKAYLLNGSTILQIDL